MVETVTHCMLHLVMHVSVQSDFKQVSTKAELEFGKQKEEARAEYVPSSSHA